MKKSLARKEKAFNWVLFALLAAGCVIVLYPFLWMLSTSVEANKYVYKDDLVPIEWHWENYANIWKEVNLVQGFVNSTVITVVTVAISTIVATIAAFAFAKLRFRGKNVAFLVLMTSSMIPFAVIMLPQFVLFKSVGLLKDAWAYVIPRLTGGVFTIFFLRQFMYSIPDSMIEAAKIDGANYIQIFFRLVLPLAMPAVTAQLILGFVSTWNDYLGPLLFIRNENFYTLPIILSKFNSASTGANNQVPMLMVASFLSMVPVLVFYAVFQKKIVDSVMMSGTTGE